MRFIFSLNPLRFSLTRETKIKITRAKSWAKTTILYNNSRLALLQINHLLTLVIFMIVSVVRENPRGLRENKKHKTRALV